jgi:hypothetical protein
MFDGLFLGPEGMKQSSIVHDVEEELHDKVYVCGSVTGIKPVAVISSKAKL